MTHAQMAWAITPRECKQNVAEIHRRGLQKEAAPEVIREAEAILARIPQPWTAFAFIHALEVSAQHYLERRGMV